MEDLKINIKPGDIKKILLERDYLSQDKEFKGICLSLKGHTMFFATTTGTKKEVRIADIKEIKATRLSPEMRKALKNAYKTQKEIDDLSNVLKETMRMIDKKNREFSDNLKKIAKHSDEMNAKDFVEYVWNHLNEPTKRALERQAFRPVIPFYDFDINGISFTYQSDIEKYCRNSGWDFVMEEYDGTLFVDPLHSRSYKKLLERYRQDVRLKTGKMREGLGIGDKDTLYYYQEFFIPVKKPFTKKYADKLAKEITI